MFGVASRLRSAGGGLHRWLFDPVPAHGMVIMRIGLGSILFLAYASRVDRIESIYGPSGFAGHDFHERFPQSEPVGWSLVQTFDQLQFVSSSAVIIALYAALLVSALCFALGVWPKVSGTLALVLHTLFLGRNPAATWGWATMIRPFLLYAILASSASYASLRSWRRHKRGGPQDQPDWTCPAWPLRLLQLHVCCVFLVLWTRIDEASWLTGQMLPMALMNRDWARFDIDWYPYFGQLEMLGQMALVLELGAPIALCIGPLRRYWALALMGMFATLVVTTSVGWWDFVMLVALATFLPPHWLERLFGAVPKLAQAKPSLDDADKR